VTGNIKQIVFDNLDSAKENGAFESGEELDGATAEEIAEDMVVYADDCDEFTTEQVLPHIKEWIKANAN
jgi:hypothetical protein